MNNPSGGTTTTLRTHLKNKHELTWGEICRIKHLTRVSRTGSSAGTDSDATSHAHEPVTREGLQVHIAQWAAVDDQVCLEFVHWYLPLLNGLATTCISHLMLLSALRSGGFSYTCHQRSVTETYLIRTNSKVLSYSSHDKPPPILGGNSR